VEERECKLKAARKKTKDPSIYRAQVKQAMNAMQSMTNSCHRTGLPAHMIKAAADSYNVLSLKLGIDLARDKHLVDANDTSVIADGRAQTQALKRG
jgi:2-keto-3-deoxy-galactonokinase